MAPELIIHQGNRDRPRISPPKVPADIYAFGMLIHEVLSRIPPNNDMISIL